LEWLNKEDCKVVVEEALLADEEAKVTLVTGTQVEADLVEVMNLEDMDQLMILQEIEETQAVDDQITENAQDLEEIQVLVVADLVMAEILAQEVGLVMVETRVLDRDRNHQAQENAQDLIGLKEDFLQVDEEVLLAEVEDVLAEVQAAQDDK
jgi:hypothetical protein